MLHLGDITKISGYTAPIVDCIIGGSPCQDLSVAGKRAGLDGERSGLYIEQVRIVKEMREQDERNGKSGVDIRPRYMVWENVPGAFSSNKGEDFRIVLEELAKVADKDAVIPMPNTGKWTNHGCIMGDGWSIAWRVLDAQFWGVPQRRRRIALVADFGGQSAPEILFVSQSLSGHTEPSEPKRKEPPSDASRGIKGALIAKDLSATLRANNAQYLFQPVYSVENHPNDSRVGIKEDGIVQTLSSRMGTGGGNVPMVLSLDRASFNQGKNAQYDFEISDKGVNSPIVAKGPSAVCYGIGAYDSNAWKSNNPNSGVYEADTSKTLCGKEPKPRYIVRRLTPLEAERLQGYPDGWTDIGEWTDSNGKKRQTSDAARYKALGNSIALPPWKWVLKRICACYERDATMASLFDGIGGFPYLWEQLNGKGSCLWASEIEEFPMAVTKVRIGGNT